ncbi:DNA polymerase III subunit delta' [Mycetocola reblochoni]|uniref:DNA polymerase III subunit delta' n=2 Tax=Mycetocola reblochoni TaxID=331618 RepID=A0A1R4JKS8_9MICO|nr:DNA polymerase III subunit delta' [Mycetocola reblochoni]RLP70551.1 DNA polymerase III subunit delta' [Mycetocola reblochoni]SJN32626.1 DNA polymerase III delta prime subunit [Mycetocola reblochoni REB411]
MGLWDDVIGQPDAVATLRAAAAADPDDPHAGMTHAWLITGPPGSGRSTLAYAFAAALLGGGPEIETQVAARTHPDLTVLRTEKVIISIDEVRSLVSSAHYAPSSGRYRVMVIEDADRMSERTSNLLLKSLEEPPERTVWLLCAPSEADLIPTIRSRVRSVRLSVPGIADVAALLERRDGVPAELAEQSARHAQSHIGMARALATDSGARERRDAAVDAVLSIGSVADAVAVAARLVEIAAADAAALGEAKNERERAELLRSLGLQEGQNVPPALRSQVRSLEEDQKRRATRAQRDGIDRILVDLMAVYRDLVLRQLGADTALIHSERAEQLEELARQNPVERTLQTLDAIATTRRRLGSNVAPTLALEALLVSAPRKALA